MKRLLGFDPFVGRKLHVLVLGTMPRTKSLATGEYYAERGAAVSLSRRTPPTHLGGASDPTSSPDGRDLETGARLHHAPLVPSVGIRDPITISGPSARPRNLAMSSPQRS